MTFNVNRNLMMLIFIVSITNLARCGTWKSVKKKVTSASEALKECMKDAAEKIKHKLAGKDENFISSTTPILQPPNIPPKKLISYSNNDDKPSEGNENKSKKDDECDKEDKDEDKEEKVKGIKTATIIYIIVGSGICGILLLLLIIFLYNYIKKKKNPQYYL